MFTGYFLVFIRVSGYREVLYTHIANKLICSVDRDHIFFKKGSVVLNSMFLLKIDTPIAELWVGMVLIFVEM